MEPCTGGQAARGTRRPPSAVRRPSGFTLLEVLLTLGLSMLLMVVVALAIDLHLRLLRTGREEVEQAQLARAILRRIAQDLHNAVQYNTSASSSSSSSSASSTSTPPVDLTQSTGDASGSRTSSLADATSLPPVPGLYGNANELQVDVSRLPRLDQLTAMLSSDTSTMAALTQDTMSDVKTVLYFLANSASGGTTVSASGTGLYRREMDRAVASFSSSQGQLLEDPSNQEPLATEVVDLEFQYYDGNEWVSEWDSTENNGLPMAVEISLTITKPQHPGETSGWSSGGSSSNSSKDSDTHTYTLLVNLPVAQPTTVQSSGTTDSMSPLGGS